MVKGRTVSRVFQRLFKPCSIPRPIIIVMPFLIALIVALISQYVVVLPVKGSSAVPYLILAGIIIAVPLVYKFRAKKIRGISLGAAIVIGFFLVPYFAFFLGRMNLYAVDQITIPGVKVIEMRPTFSKVVWVDNENNEATVWPGPVTLYLRPGVTRVHVGTLNVPAGMYVANVIYLDTIETDMQVDLSVWTDPESGEAIPPEMYSEVYENFRSEFDTHFQSEFPQGSSSNWALSGSVVSLTMSTGPFQVREHDEKYYSGFGGPDVTLDFTLTEDGMVTVTPIIDMPPGFPTPPIATPS